MKTYWLFCKRKLQHFWFLLSHWQFQLNFKNFQIYYRGEGRLLYYLQWKGNIQSGVIQLRLWHGLLFSLFLLVLTQLLGQLFTSQEEINLKLLESRQVGGVGTLKPDLRHSTLAEEMTEKFSQEDERLKDLLLGLAIDKKALKKSSVKKTESKKEIPKIDYKVKPGDTLTKIAKQHNVTVESILGHVKLADPNRLVVGQTLLIPAKVGFYYQVKKNEKLAHILARHKVSLEKFLEENPAINPDLLTPGEQIFLPGAKPILPIVSWLIPVASRIVTSGYGFRTWPREAFHKGIDLKAVYTTVRAAKAGEVLYAGWLGGYGNVVVLSHEGGYKSLYAHLSRIHVKEGQQVARGQSVGISGNTGYSFGPHLHFEITKNGENINPAKVLPGLIFKRR